MKQIIYLLTSRYYCLGLSVSLVREPAEQIIYIVSRVWYILSFRLSVSLFVYLTDFTIPLAAPWLK